MFSYTVKSFKVKMLLSYLSEKVYLLSYLSGPIILNTYSGDCTNQYKVAKAVPFKKKEKWYNFISGESLSRFFLFGTLNILSLPQYFFESNFFFFFFSGLIFDKLPILFIVKLRSQQFLFLYYSLALLQRCIVSLNCWRAYVNSTVLDEVLI